MGIAEELINRGWTQGVAEAEDGSVCLRGAAAYACGKSPVWAFTLPEHYEDALVRAIGCRLPLIGIWNDEPGRTYDEVLRVAKLTDEILDAG
jgi:hypothetical protein